MDSSTSEILWTNCIPVRTKNGVIQSAKLLVGLFIKKIQYPDMQESTYMTNLYTLEV